ncbi:hypothetical protein EFK50_01785 [Nocardioides marmoriginsengisoli]|uniref:Mycothiol-dependent maleylpyruvate isomerase metal-binding domain-containing protein n=1 Tax=Nocardioides marmoriginsengisoli TaxID=661483 RepID=A0A3N0CQZ4_9ACTN|nr:maleylpyruvate isomerase N-terminal domain-containing protein [Nocardioides marmoriginsengisoli]RNL65800.1 hypothetical protein EFK50_01785 [Nocardioides marmoriginsengisoli]
MTLSVADCTAAIRTHTEGLAAAAEGNLDKRIEHCPDWSMANLVWHLASVHRFWNQVVTELPTELPDEDQEGADDTRPPDDELILTLLAGMETLLASLEAADQSAPCWTWGLEENVWFVTRHQVQEAAVHHWDAVNAAGTGSWSMDPVVAMDAVEEFLTHSVANTRWPAMADPIGTTISLGVARPGGEAVITISDGDVPGTLRHEIRSGSTPAPVDPATLLLWLFRRVPDDALAGQGLDGALLNRFRSFTNTD